MIPAAALGLAVLVGACSTGTAKKTSASAGGTLHSQFGETPAPDRSSSGRALSREGAATTAVGSSAATSESRAPAGTASAPAPGGGPSNVTVGLRAGSVDDNARFADYLSYRQSAAQLHLTVHDLDVTERHIFTVTQPSGAPVVGAAIVITDDAGAKVDELRTYADGRALWFPAAHHLQGRRFAATVSKDGATHQVSVDRGTTDHPVTLDDAPAAGPTKLDVEFLVDATGSMGDEIAQLKTSLSDIAQRISGLPAHPDVRFALTVFRDRSDTFLTRTWNFSGDVASFQQAIAGVSADGGGDTPEDVQQGLHDAIVKPSWRGPGTVKLVFLVGDAPPHLDYQNDPDYVASIGDAARLGIKIESLAASGLDDQGEYIWRQLAQATLGQFLFLTYGPNGGPGDTTTHHVSGYSSNNLDDVVVDLVSHELSPAATPKSGQQ